MGKHKIKNIQNIEEKKLQKLEWTKVTTKDIFVKRGEHNFKSYN